MCLTWHEETKEHYEKKLNKNIGPNDILQMYTKYLVNVLKFTKHLVNINKCSQIYEIFSKFLPPKRRKTLHSY